MVRSIPHLKAHEHDDVLLPLLQIARVERALVCNARVEHHDELSVDRLRAGAAWTL